MSDQPRRTEFHIWTAEELARDAAALSRVPRADREFFAIDPASPEVIVVARVWLDDPIAARVCP